MKTLTATGHLIISGIAIAAATVLAVTHVIDGNVAVQVIGIFGGVSLGAATVNSTS